jgi:hypothetical protein
MLEQLKADVLAANLALPAHHLVTGRAGSPRLGHHPRRLFLRCHPLHATDDRRGD